MRLNRTPNPLNRDARNKENENWDTIQQKFNNVVEEVSDAAFQKVIDGSKIDWEQMVDKVSDLPSNVETGETRGVKEDNKIYRFDGTDWIPIAEINLNPIAEVDSRLSSQLADNVKRSKLKSVFIEDFGGKGDGVFDNTQAINDALNFIGSIGGGKLIFKEGTYNVSGVITMVSNLDFIIGGSAKIKTIGQTHFHYPSFSKGYDGGLKNIKIYGGGGFEGNFDDNIKFSHAMHHTSNVVVDNVYFKTPLNNGHVFDLCGCDNFYIKNCTFYGNKVTTNRFFTEAIQIDYSDLASFSYYDENDINSIDSIPTRNVYVENCKFLPIYNDSNDIIHYSMPPLGAHGSSALGAYENINFINNVVVDCIYTESPNYGVLHFQCVDGLNIKNNIIKSTTNSGNSVIVINDEIGGNTNKNNKSDNIFIENNLIYGFESKRFSFIEIKNLESYKSENIKVIDNKFKNKGNKEKDCLIVRNFKNLVIKGNKIENFKRLIFYDSDGGIENLSITDNEIINSNDVISVSKLYTTPHKVFYLDNNVIFNTPTIGEISGFEVVYIQKNKGFNITKSNNIIDLSNVTKYVLINENIFIPGGDGNIMSSLVSSEGFIKNNIFKGYKLETIPDNEKVVIKDNIL